MTKTTQLYSYHKGHAKLTEFAGYEMPLWYTTTSEEHLSVRNTSGIFDVSHMARFDVRGESASEFLEGLVPTGVAAQQIGKAFYTLLLNEKAGIIDDLIIMRLADDHFLMVVNAANADADMAHIRESLPGTGVAIDDVTSSTVMIAVQGPQAARALQPLAQLDLAQLKRFRCAETTILSQPSLISRTGYTGEDGFEVVVQGPTNENPGKALEVWDALAASSTPCGLGARDSLRLEAGFPLHGSDIDQSTDPYQADLAWVVTTGKSGYIGSDAMARLAVRPPSLIRRGLTLDEGIPRHGFEVVQGGRKVGDVTSGTFSPLLRRGIGLCMVKQEDSAPGKTVKVAVRGDARDARITKPPFYDEQLYGWRRQR